MITYQTANTWSHQSLFRLLCECGNVKVYCFIFDVCLRDRDRQRDTGRAEHVWRSMCPDCNSFLSFPIKHWNYHLVGKHCTVTIYTFKPMRQWLNFPWLSKLRQNLGALTIQVIWSCLYWPLMSNKSSIQQQGRNPLKKNPLKNKLNLT